MNALRAVLKQVDALAGCMRDAEFEHRLRFIAAAVELGCEFKWQYGSAAHSKPLHLGGIGDGHNACQNRHPDADLARALNEFEILPIVEKQLGDDEIQALIHLALQVGEIDSRIAALPLLFPLARTTHAQRRIVPL